jgi:hypothetical protein
MTPGAKKSGEESTGRRARKGRGKDTMGKAEGRQDKPNPREEKETKGGFC